MVAGCDKSVVNSIKTHLNSQTRSAIEQFKRFENVFYFQHGNTF